MYTSWQLHSCQGVLIVEYVMNLHRESFENFKSNICHKLRSYGDLNFLTNILIEPESVEFDWLKINETG